MGSVSEFLTPAECAALKSKIIVIPREAEKQYEYQEVEQHGITVFLMIHNCRLRRCACWWMPQQFG